MPSPRFYVHRRVLAENAQGIRSRLVYGRADPVYPEAHAALRRRRSPELFLAEYGQFAHGRFIHIPDLFSALKTHPQFSRIYKLVEAIAIMVR